MARRRNILLLNPPGRETYMRDYYCSHASKAAYNWGPFDLIVLSGILGHASALPHGRASALPPENLTRPANLPQRPDREGGQDDRASVPDADLGGFEITVLDAMIEGLVPRQAMDRIARMDVDTIVFLTGAVSWDQDFEFLANLIRGTGRPYDCIGCGDVLFAEDRKFLERYDFLKACILDFTSRDVLDWLAGAQGPFAALSYKRPDGTVVAATRAFTREKFTLPPPLYHLFPMRKYRIPHGRRTPYAGFLASYGCPYHCSYCIGGELGFKLRDLDNAVEEMRRLRQMGIREIWFKDLVFGVNRDYYRRLVERMIDEKLGFSWVCLSRANVLDEEFLALMRRAGCHTIQLGIETGDDELLQRYSKGLDVNMIKRAVALCKAAGIRVLGHYMIGLPGDSEEKIEQTVNYAIALDTEFASFNVAMPRMGTPFRDEAIRDGLISDETTVLDNSRSLPVYDLPGLPRERLWQLRNHAIRRFHLRPSYICKRLAGVRSLHELATLFREGISLLVSTLK
jgi:hypothetical protein